MSVPAFCIVYIEEGQPENNIVWEKSSGFKATGAFSECVHPEKFTSIYDYNMPSDGHYCYVKNNCGGTTGQNRFCLWDDEQKQTIRIDEDGSYCS